MSSITDWLTSIGTISAVILSLAYSIIGRNTEKRRKRRNLILKTASMSEILFHEIDSLPSEHPVGDMSEPRSYKAYQIYLSAVSVSTDPENEDILMLGESLSNCLNDYYKNRNENNKTNYFDILKQLKEMK